jgi:uncharacterized protein (TIGR04255 family)
MPEQPYKRPPITEAVIGLRFADPIDSATLDKVASALKPLYPREDILKGVHFQMRLDATSPAPQSIEQEIGNGYRLSSPDQTHILILTPMPPSLSMSQLAPYPGWDQFFGRFRRDWDVWKKSVGYRKIIRVGVRYINRIDIPTTDPIVYEEQFLNVYPHIPEVLGPMMQYAVQTQLSIADIGCILTLNSSVVPSPLIGHRSFVIDLDIGKDSPPQNDDAIYELINRIRGAKNHVFEACITDRARELFEPWLE